jgi:hypothetical protein
MICAIVYNKHRLECDKSDNGKQYEELLRLFRKK